MALVVGNDLRAVNAAPFDGAERYRGFGFGDQQVVCLLRPGAAAQRMAAVSSIVRFMRVFLI